MACTFLFVGCGSNDDKVDVEYINGSDVDFSKRNTRITVKDNFEEESFIRTTAMVHMNGEQFGVETVLLVEETRTGKLLFVIADDVTNVIIITNLLQGVNSHFNFDFGITVE